jgi:alkyl sulfatase BDS1-like metallo-beta-lactamase superfamily hydrolase
MRVLVSGDNYYHAFPNLYAIRGTTTRDVLSWVASLDAMRALRPEFLVER